MLAKGPLVNPPQPKKETSQKKMQLRQTALFVPQIFDCRALLKIRKQAKTCLRVQVEKAVRCQGVDQQKMQQKTLLLLAKQQPKAQASQQQEAWL